MAVNKIFRVAKNEYIKWITNPKLIIFAVLMIFAYDYVILDLLEAADKMGVKLLGTNAEAIDKAEDRQLFRDTMESINQPCIPSEISYDIETSLAIAKQIGYPVIVRPAFTLGGAGGGVKIDPIGFLVVKDGNIICGLGFGSYLLLHVYNKFTKHIIRWGWNRLLLVT